MNRWLVLGVGIIALFLASRALGVTVPILGSKASTKLNNPGNIRHSSDKWVGMSQIQTDPNFVQFDTPDDGIRALARNLKTYFSKGINTIAKIIATWAPPNENNTAAYIAHVAQMLNTDPNKVLSSNVATLNALTNAIITHEQGSNPFNSDFVLANVQRA